MENDLNFVKTVDKDGNEVMCDVLFTFDSEETGKSYIAYTDNTKDEEGNVRVYAGTYNKEDPSEPLKNIESKEEWRVIEATLMTLQDKYSEEDK